MADLVDHERKHGLCSWQLPRVACMSLVSHHQTGGIQELLEGQEQ